MTDGNGARSLSRCQQLATIEELAWSLGLRVDVWRVESAEKADRIIRCLDVVERRERFGMGMRGVPTMKVD